MQSRSLYRMLNLKYKNPAYQPLPAQNAVTLCRGVSWGNDYHHVVKFASASQQYATIAAKAKYVDSALSPITFSAPLKLPHVADDLLDCNYLILQNLTFSDRTYYAFITKVTYVNPNCCEVSFEIDYFQSYLFDFQLGRCMVEREHVADDTIGANIIDEGLQLTEYTCQDEQRANICEEKGIRIIYLPGGEDLSGDVKDNIYNALKMRVVPVNVTDAIDDLVNRNVETPDNVVSIQMVPYAFYNDQQTSKRLNFTYEPDFDNLDGYVPKNNKLFTYPYNFLYVDNGQGQAREFHFENWPQGRKPYFTLYCSILSGAEITIICTPGALHNGWDLGQNVSETLTLSGFPLCPWVSDTYKAYVAQNNNNYTAALGNITVGALTTMALNPTPAGATAAMATALGNIAVNEINRYATLQNARLMPDKVHGAEGTNTYWSYNMMDFYFCRRCVRYDIAKSIDDYFSAYGYRVEKLKIPETNNRLSWNYVKTNGAVITGQIPTAAKQAITAAFDSGVTLWHGDYIGEYNRDNSIR